MVRSDAPFRTLEGPDGKQIMFRSPTALGANVPPRADIMRAHGIAHLPQDGNFHDSVHRPVVTGFYPAGGGVSITFSSCLEKLRSRLRILYRTVKYTPYAMAALSMIPFGTAKMITNAVLEIGSFKKKIMHLLGMKSFMLAKENVWDDVRNLHLTSKQTEIAERGSIKCRFD